MTIVTDRAKEVFLDALEIESPNDRCRFLDRACGEDAGLRGEVEDLIAHHSRVGSFLVSHPHYFGEPAGTAPAEQPGTQIRIGSPGRRSLRIAGKAVALRASKTAGSRKNSVTLIKRSS